MQHNNLADDYDLDSVTARLAAMEARRMKWQGRKKESTEQQILSDRETACGFELAPADLSSGGSDANSDGGYESNSTNSLPSDDDKVTTSWSQLQTRKRQPERGRKQRLRVTDSLDLSMSVETSTFQADTRRSSRKMKRAPHSKVQAEEHIRRCSLENSSNQMPFRSQPENIVRPSRIPKLVQQRRQLQAERKYSSASTHSRESLQTPFSVASHHVPPSKGTPLPPDESLSLPEPPKPRSTGSPLRNKLKTKDPTPLTKVKANNHGGIPEEIASSEEQRLLESLEKLDRRLTNISTPSVVVREGGQHPSSHKERTLKRDASRTISNAKDSISGCIRNGEVDEEILRTAAYGGGSHCKSHQPSSVSVRSSSAKRAELSSGVHKARVRVGGALVNDTSRNSSGGGSGKHKIVVKKDLAHLLF
ncbi:hypothetical protein V7S43_011526 [Phytophthora oleae]|uniref:Uncharacterized protein n=1 Tax=Phytophthora oleae TaxID=2107226 RepID=A0ABD3FDS2_9STRA